MSDNSWILIGKLLAILAIFQLAIQLPMLIPLIVILGVIAYVLRRTRYFKVIYKISLFLLSAYFIIFILFSV